MAPLLDGPYREAKKDAKDKKIPAHAQSKSFLNSDGEDEDEPGGFTPHPAAAALFISLHRSKIDLGDKSV